MELKEFQMEQAYLKCGILGFAGSGKTFTAANIAVGLHDYIQSKKPIAFISTEPGVDFLIKDFNSLGKTLVGNRTKAFLDLLDLTRKAEKACDILIIDSISHFYEELVKAYQKRLNKPRLRVQDWAPIKAEWAQFTDLFLNSRVHILMLGRAAWEYDFKEDDEGVTEITKTGTKMRTEKELGYEPSLLIEMERVRDNNGQIGQEFLHRAWILKDRFNQINGKNFDFTRQNKMFPIKGVFEAFLPHISLLNIGGEHEGPDTTRNSQALFDSPEGRMNLGKRRDIALENIENEMTKRIPGRSAKDSKDKIALLEQIFGTASWTAIKEQHPDKLEICLTALKALPIKEEANV